MNFNEYYQAIIACSTLQEQYQKASQKMEKLENEYSHHILNEFRKSFKIKGDEIQFEFNRPNNEVRIIRKIKANRLTNIHLLQSSEFTIKDIEAREHEYNTIYTITYVWSLS